MAKTEYMFPDDDGRRQRAWIVEGDERGRSSCERVIKVLSELPWVGNIKETKNGEEDDCFGVDILAKIDWKLLSVLGVWTEGLPVPVQVKSSEHKQRDFVFSHRKHIFNTGKGEHIFVLDGQDALDVIKADLVGQMIYLSYLSSQKKKGEEEFLEILEKEMGDIESVKRYKKNREILLEAKWYGPLILDMKK